jgi:FixJ family two-component response regulator
MSAMSGLELQRHLTTAGYAIPTILITAYPNQNVRARALREGAVCYMRKPVEEGLLLLCLRAAFHPGYPPEEYS